MNFDATIRRHLSVLVCLLLGTAAYFQARGIGFLVEASLSDPRSLPSRPTNVGVAPSERSEHTTNAALILERNPFDSGFGACPVPERTCSRQPMPICRTGEDSYLVDWIVIDLLMENPGALRRCGRVVPEQENGKVTGLRLAGIRPDSLPAALGFENEDRLLRINGLDLTRPTPNLEVYVQLRRRDRAVVELRRHGKPRTMVFVLR